MKKNILLSGLVALLAIFSGCEMNEEPKSEASVDMVFSSVSYTHLTLPTNSRV